MWYAHVCKVSIIACVEHCIKLVDSKVSDLLVQLASVQSVRSSPPPRNKTSPVGIEGMSPPTCNTTDTDKLNL